MRKRVLVILIATMMVLTLTACAGGNSANSGGSGTDSSSGQQSGAEISADAIKTVEDAMTMETADSQYAFYDDVFVYVFGEEGEYYRVLADIPKETSDKLWALDYEDPDYEKKFNDLVYPLEVKTFENLSDQKMSQEEMDAFVGKTGQELLDAGWNSGMGYNLDDMVFWLDYGPFQYAVTFDGATDSTNYDDIDEEEFIKDLTVKSVEYMSLGDGTNIEGH